MVTRVELGEKKNELFCTMNNLRSGFVEPIERISPGLRFGLKEEMVSINLLNIIKLRPALQV